MGILDKISGKKAPAKKPAAKKKDEDKAVVAASAKAEKESKAEAQDLSGEAYRVLVAPLFTEKSARLNAQGQYAFAVARSATKVDVARAVRALYGVKPVSVRVLNVLGKVVRYGRSSGRQKDVKKAIVTLKKGDSIALSA